MYFRRSNPVEWDKKKEIREKLIKKEETTLSLFINNMLFDTEDPRKTLHELLELVEISVSMLNTTTIQADVSSLYYPCLEG